MIEQLLQADRLLAVDQVDAAEAIYRRVSELDPMDAIAVVGLARCALARGEDRRAHELASRALAIDGGNDMARRMEARLAEIFAARGEPVARPVSTDGAGVEARPMRPITTPAARHDESGPTPASAGTAVRRRGLWDRLRGR